MNIDRRLAVGCLFAGIVLLFAAVGLYASQQQMSSTVSYLGIAGVALLVCYGLLAPTAALDLVRNRQARFGSLSVLVSAIFVGILVMANVLAARSTQAYDLTRGQLYTLSPKSVAVLRQLDSDVTITGFFRPGTETADLSSATALLDQYRRASSHIKVSIVNPDTHAEQASRLGVTINGSFAVQYKDRPATVLLLGSHSESDFTSAILKLEANRSPQVCWAAGEGERDLSQTGDYGYSQFKTQLGSDNFKVREVILSQTAQVPSDCDVLAIVGIQRAIPSPVVAAIQHYVAGGGSLLLAVDPWLDGPVAASANSVLAPYGASFSNGAVLENDPAHLDTEGDTTTPVVLSYGDSPITRDLANRFTFFPQPTAIKEADTADVTTVDIAQTTASAYEVSTPRDVSQLGRRPGDPSGPFTLMATLEKQGGAGTAGKRSRIVLVGTSAFGENLAIPPGYNAQLLLGSFDWLAGNDQLIALPPKPPAASPLQLTAEEYDLDFALLVGVVPALILLAGLGVYLRRRSYAG